MHVVTVFRTEDTQSSWQDKPEHQASHTISAHYSYVCAVTVYLQTHISSEPIIDATL